jgi:hypothetical protein
MSKMVHPLPVIPVLQTCEEWQITLQPQDDPMFAFVLPPHPPGWRRNETTTQNRRLRENDPFIVRARFFEIETPNDALTFFQDFGPYSTDLIRMEFSGVKQQQAFYRDALLNRPIRHEEKPFNPDDEESFYDYYLWGNLPVELIFQQPMKAIAICKDVEAALRATVFLDRLRGLPWRACARPDCGRPFELPPRRLKLYCSAECAHLQSVRSYNSRKQLDKGKAAEAAKLTAKPKPIAKKKPAIKKGKG